MIENDAKPTFIPYIFKCKMPTLVKFIESTQSLRHMKHEILPVDVTLWHISTRIQFHFNVPRFVCLLLQYFVQSCRVFFFFIVRNKFPFRFYFVSAKLMHKFWMTALRTSDFYFVSYFSLRSVRIIISIFHSALYSSAMKLNLIDAKATEKKTHRKWNV